jgi:hypothetical protein
MKIKDSDNPNLYGTFEGKKESLASAFAAKGWHSRKSTWIDYEVENKWAELIIEGTEPECLINGFVLNTNENIKQIINIIDNTVSTWTLEIYDNHGVLLQEFKKQI